MGLYEIQVLDSYNSKTYADGQVSAVYGQYPPLVNAARAPGNGRPTTSSGMARALTQPANSLARARHIFHNGVLTQDNVELTGPTGHHVAAVRRSPDKLPLSLQDHNHPVRYRNIWLRELAPSS